MVQLKKILIRGGHIFNVLALIKGYFMQYPYPTGGGVERLICSTKVGESYG